MTAPYCWLSDVRTEINANTTVDDTQVMVNAHQASRRIDGVFQSRWPVFLPYKRTVDIPVTSDMVNSVNNTLTVPGHLLAINSLVVGGTTVTAYEIWPPNDSASNTLRLTDDCSAGWYSYQTTNKPLLATIDGIWGLNRDYAYAWERIDTLGADLTSSATTFTAVTAAAFDVGQLLRIESEYIEVTGKSSSTITIKRAQNGTTAAAHASGTGIDVWLVELPIRRAAAKQASFMYTRIGAYNNFKIDALGVTDFPSDLLPEVYGAIQGYAYD